MWNSEFQMKRVNGNSLIFHHLSHSCLLWYVPMTFSTQTLQCMVVTEVQTFTLCEQSAANLKVYYATCFTLIASIMVFGGFLAPIVSHSSQFWYH